MHSFIYLDSDADEPHTGKLSYGGAFSIGTNAPYGGAFTNVPDRVGSAPAIDIGMVRLIHLLIRTFYMRRNMQILGQSLLRARSFLSSSSPLS